MHELNAILRPDSINY